MKNSVSMCSQRVSMHDQRIDSRLFVDVPHIFGLFASRLGQLESELNCFRPPFFSPPSEVKEK